MAQSSVMARLERNTGRKGSPRDVGPLLLEWKDDRTYAPVMKRGGMPPKVAARLTKATAELWAAARAEAETEPSKGIATAWRRF